VLDRPSGATQVWPQTRVLVLAAGLIGLLGGLFLVFALEYFDDTLKTREDVDQLLGLSTLASIPRPGVGQRVAEKRALAAVAQKGEQRVS
jgi:protein tyrosine kinase modulator